jgi:peptidyl-prolyl cis-trans isomerase A (cyclophilin A)
MSTIVSNPIGDIFVNTNNIVQSINLFSYFDDPFTTGKVARFRLYDTSIGNGVINVVLFDQQGEGAPLTVQNFLNYVNDSDYNNTIIHRSVENFVIQGGGFTISNSKLGSVPADPPVQNEFSVNRSNLPGTLTMAKLGNDPNSATSQWFFNLADNSTNLNNQNGGFTVFGEVLSSTDFSTVQAIADIPVFNATQQLGQAFGEVPLMIDPANPVIEGDEDFVRFQNITVSQQPELNFSVVSNSRPDLVDVYVAGGQLHFDYQPNVTGTADIVIKATNLLGDQVNSSFKLNIQEVIPDTTSSLNDSIYRFYNPYSQGHFFTATPSERDTVIANPDWGYVFEGSPFKVSTTEGGNLKPVYRFYNPFSRGHFFTINEDEKNTVIANPDWGYKFEGVGFYALDANANIEEDVYRFYNPVSRGHFFTTSEAERDTVINNPQWGYKFEGVAFEANAL